MALSNELPDLFPWVYDREVIKALFFDYGGVIADDSAGKNLYEQLAANLAISTDAAWKMLSPLWPQLSRGTISESEVWEKLEQRYGRSIALDKRAIWNSWARMPIHEEMLNFANELKQNGYVIGIISTTIESTAEDIRAHGGYAPFDPVILSYEVGYAKPDPEIYRIALERLPGTASNEVIFLDDREMCIPPAQQLGMHTVLVENPLQAIAATRHLLEVNR